MNAQKPKTLLRSAYRGLLRVYLRPLGVFNRLSDRYNHRSSVIISGSPRGGTTWLAEVLTANISDSTELWEEFADDIDVAAGQSEQQHAAEERLREAGLEGSWTCPNAPPKMW